MINAYSFLVRIFVMPMAMRIRAKPMSNSPQRANKEVIVQPFFDFVKVCVAQI
jgi:hypothetical protein